jgi:hypothetical protein
MIHAGIFVQHTDGCPMPGTQYKKLNNDSLLDLYQSGNAMRELWQNLPSEFSVVIQNKKKYE